MWLRGKKLLNLITNNNLKKKCVSFRNLNLTRVRTKNAILSLIFEANLTKITSLRILYGLIT